MIIKFLGTAAGGGFPQWNCSCFNCESVRQNKKGFTARRQSSVALVSGNVREGIGSSDTRGSYEGDAQSVGFQQSPAEKSSKFEKNWVLINASPDLREQMRDLSSQFGPRPRQTNLKGVVLVDAQLDHAGGLFLMRENESPLPIYATSQVHEDLTHHHSLLKLLESYCGSNWTEISVSGEPFKVADFPDAEFFPIAVPSKAPPYSPRRNKESGGETIALRIMSVKTGKSALYAPGIEKWTEELEKHAAESDVLIVEGTCWEDGDLKKARCREKLGSEMGHLYLNGEDGLLSVLSKFPDKRKILVHINNTNPILNENGPEHAACIEAGVEVGVDGMEIHL